MTVDGQLLADVVYGMCALLAVWMGAMGYRQSQIDAADRRLRQAEPWESTCVVTAADLELEQAAEEAERLRDAESREQHWRRVAAAPPDFIIQESP